MHARTSTRKKNSPPPAPVYLIICSAWCAFSRAPPSLPFPRLLRKKFTPRAHLPIVSDSDHVVPALWKCDNSVRVFVSFWLDPALPFHILASLSLSLFIFILTIHAGPYGIMCLRSAVCGQPRPHVRSERNNARPNPIVSKESSHNGQQKVSPLHRSTPPWPQVSCCLKLPPLGGLLVNHVVWLPLEAGLFRTNSTSRASSGPFPATRSFFYSSGRVRERGLEARSTTSPS
jgi:hypothetical protein